MSNGNIFKSALIGGVALGIVSVLPFLEAFNCICCAWAIAGGMLAANLYIKDSKDSKASTDLPSHFEPSSPASDLYNKDSKVSTDSP
ncbi:MAG: hypothetical protein LBP68_02690, partial [Acidobacteriota bacterium]|nr:hypothetical protein [Acidobacteriota bacterium]